MSVKMPPIEKIHEAYSAIADERIVLKENEAEISSSDYAKKYTVTWKDNTYTSNDNASYWQGYVGYPIIAILMLQNKLPYDKTIAAHFKGVNWKKLNTENKNNYSKVVKLILEDLELKGVNCKEVNTEIEKVYDEIKKLDIKLKRSSTKPPK